MTYKDFIKEYGEEEVRFTSYYKYEFTFKNKNVTVWCGGSSDDIYKFAVDTEPIKIKDIEAPISEIEIGGEYYFL